MNKPKSLLIAFVVVSIVNIGSVTMGWQAGVYFSKPLLLTLLSLWFWEKTKTVQSPFSHFILFGLIASIAGDTFLLFAQNAPIYFLLGLGSFFIAHLCYITAFFRHPKKKGFFKPLALLPILVYLIAFIYYLLPDLPEGFRIPVVLYGTVISTMLYMSLHMNAFTKAKTLTMGAMLFVLSDSIIAIGKFKEVGVPENLISLTIMITYLAGQYLIAKNSIELNQAIQ